jgi:hypothetical protein
MLGQADQRVADFRTAILAFMFGKQADPGLHHRGYSLDVGDAEILPAQASRWWVLTVTLSLPSSCSGVDWYN